jgi:YNFM family putative membrane transporter
MGGHFSDPRLTGAYVVGAALFFGFVGLFTYLPYLLTSPPFALSTGSVSWFYAAYLAGIVTAPLTGRFAGRLSRKLLMAAGFVVAMLGMLLTAVPSLGAVVAGTIVVCVGTFIAQAIAPAYVNTVATSAKGSANALYQTFYYLGAVFGSTLPGLAYERFGWSGTIGSCLASLAVGLLAALLFCGDDDRPIENEARRRQRSAGGARANVDSGQSAL